MKMRQLLGRNISVNPQLTGVPMLEFNNFFKQCVAGGLELATLVFREKHLSHGGVLFLVNLGMVFAVTIPVFKMGAKPRLPVLIGGSITRNYS